MKAIVNFRTLPNGAFKYMRGMRRGWYRVLVVRDENGSTSINSNNVVAVLYNSPDGIEGVSSRSKYCLDFFLNHAHTVAGQYNAERAYAAREQMQAEGEGMTIR